MKSPRRAQAQQNAKAQSKGASALPLPDQRSRSKPTGLARWGAGRVPRLSLERRLRLKAVLRESLTDKKQETKRICEAVDRKKRLLKREFVLRECARRGLGAGSDARGHLFSSCQENNLSLLKYRQMLRRNKRKRFREQDKENGPAQARGPSAGPREKSAPKDSRVPFSRLLNELGADCRWKRDRLAALKAALRLRAKSKGTKRPARLPQWRAPAKRRRWKSKSILQFGNAERRRRQKRGRGSHSKAKAPREREVTFASQGSNAVAATRTKARLLEGETHMQRCLEEKLRRAEKDLLLLRRKTRALQRAERAQLFNQRLADWKTAARKVGDQNREARRLSLRILDCKASLRGMEAQRESRAGALARRRKDVRELEQNTAIVLHKQEEARRVLAEVDARLAQLKKAGERQQAEFEKLISKDGAISRLESVLDFLKGKGECAAESEEGEKASCRSNAELKQRVAEIREHFHAANARIRGLTEKFAKKEEAVARRTAELQKADEDLAQKSRMLQKVSDARNTFEDVAKAFAEQKGAREPPKAARRSRERRSPAREAEARALRQTEAQNKELLAKVGSPVQRAVQGPGAPAALRDLVLRAPRGFPPRNRNHRGKRGLRAEGGQDGARAPGTGRTAARGGLFHAHRHCEFGVRARRLPAEPAARARPAAENRRRRPGRRRVPADGVAALAAGAQSGLDPPQVQDARRGRAPVPRQKRVFASAGPLRAPSAARVRRLPRRLFPVELSQRGSDDPRRSGLRAGVHGLLLSPGGLVQEIPGRLTSWSSRAWLRKTRNCAARERRWTRGVSCSSLLGRAAA